MPASNVIHSVELPIDDRPHGIDLTGDILHAAVRRPGAVDVWYQAHRDQTIQHARRSFQIVATGQPFPPHLGRHHATAITTDGSLVWHVLENHCQHPNATTTAELGDPPGRGTGICHDCQVTLRGDGTGGWIPA